MPDLYHTLLKYDIGHLRIIAGLWGLELDSSDVDSAAEELCASLLDLEAVRETMDILSADARAALKSLVASNGKMEWSSFARKFGEIREMGEGKRERLFFTTAFSPKHFSTQTKAHRNSHTSLTIYWN
jgi:hypothetical protein